MTKSEPSYMQLWLIGNGYQLGTTPTPAQPVALTTGGTIASGKTICLFCVALTPWARARIFDWVQPPFLRTNADGSQDLINAEPQRSPRQVPL